MNLIGNIVDRFNRSKISKKLLLSRQVRTARLKELYRASSIYRDVDFESIRISPEEAERVKNEIREKMRSERRQALAISITIVLVLLMMLTALIIFIIRTRHILDWQFF